MGENSPNLVTLVAASHLKVETRRRHSFQLSMIARAIEMFAQKSGICSQA
jgi:hypothetical protein